MTTIQLQSIGHVPAIAASEVREGDLKMYNFGATGLIIKVIEKTAKTLSIITFENGKYYMSDVRKTSLMAIVKRDQDVSEHNPTEAYNGRKGLVDVSEFFQTEELETLQEEIIEPITEAIEEVKEESAGVTYTLNNEKNGIELHFTDKPNEEIRNMIKAAGYKWSKFQKLWYAKQNDKTIAIAEQLATKEETTKEPIEFHYDYIEIDDCLDEKYNIPQSLQDREHDAYWVMRTSKRDHNKELQNLFIHCTEQIKNVISITDNEYYIYKLKLALQRFKKNYHTAYIKYMNHKANNPSWVTTGRGGMNVSKYNQKMNRQDTLMLELTNLPEELKSYISKYRNKIRKDKETAIKAQIQEELKQPLPELTFKTVTKEFDLYNNGSKIKSRFYEAEGYSICKVWGAFRVYEIATGKEIHSTKSNGTLKDAKAYVQMLVKRKAA
jgi:hypothetical protein